MTTPLMPAPYDAGVDQADETRLTRLATAIDQLDAAGERRQRWKAEGKALPEVTQAAIDAGLLAGMTQEEIARRLGMEPGSIHRSSQLDWSADRKRRLLEEAGGTGD